MPSSASRVGAFALPPEAGNLGDAFEDPLVVGLLDYLAFWLNWGLNAKLSAQIGTSAEAVPEANRYPFDPARYFVRRGIPALYVWCESTEPVGEWTTMQRISRRTVKAMWVFDELVAPAGVAMRHGLLRAADNLLTLAEATDRHREWPDVGSRYAGTIPQGAQFGPSFGLRKWAKQAATLGAMWQVPDTRADGAVQLGHPALQTSFLVEELVGFETMLGSDALSYGTTEIAGGGHDGAGFTVELHTAIADVPDQPAIGDEALGA